MNIVLKRLLTLFLSLFLISYVGYQAYSALYNPIKTTRAESGTYEDIIKTQGYVLHSETVITSNQSGIIDYDRQDGECVEKGGEVAALYRTEQDAENQSKIESLQSEIQNYQQMGSAANISTIDIDVLDSEIEKSFLGLTAAAAGSDTADLVSLKSDMLSLLNKKQLATGEITNFTPQISKLQSELSQLSASTGGQTGKIYAPAAGYFVSSTDGLENAYNFNSALSITAGDVKALLQKKGSPQPDAVGKIISGYQSYIACDLSADDAYKLHVGDTVQLQFLLSSQPQINVTVAAINKDASGVAVVFQCDTMTSALAVIRRQTVEIVANSYTGIKVSDNYIHIVGGTKGVFVRYGNMAEFRKLDPIYSTSDYTVSAIDPSQSKQLQVYDEVIENGDDLHDGEVIK